uniref:Uncharacterized protein n=1 Tax=Tetradesmus obliquus TaxID=3088 RepID=A0A383VNL8_TETOB|eukprot:jgi/Sobl393_1/19440/SZX66006.1
MSSSNVSAVKGWLVGLRSLQIAALLALSALYAIALTGFAAGLDMAKQGYFESATAVIEAVMAVGMGLMTVSLAFTLAAAALSITWLVYTLKPARRAAASCCGNHASCINFRHDVAWDSVFAVVYGLNVLAGVLQRGTLVGTIVSAIMTVLFIATAVLSSKMGRAVREVQQGHGVAVGTPAAAAGLAAPPKVVEVV